MTAIDQQLLVVTGPESSGKSTLAHWLAEQLAAPLVPEVARSYLEGQPTPEYGPDDLRAIATQQLQAQRQALATGAPVVIADTDVRVLELWWAEAFPNLPPPFSDVSSAEQALLSLGQQRVYLLCYPDLTWEPDPLREHPNDRLRLFQLQLQALERDKADFRVIWGEGKIRSARAWHYVCEVLGSNRRQRD